MEFQTQLSEYCKVSNGPVGFSRHAWRLPGAHGQLGGPPNLSDEHLVNVDR